MARGRGGNEAARDRWSQLARASASSRLATSTNSAAVPGIATTLLHRRSLVDESNETARGEEPAIPAKKLDRTTLLVFLSFFGGLVALVALNMK